MEESVDIIFSVENKPSNDEISFAKKDETSNNDLVIYCDGSCVNQHDETIREAGWAIYIDSFASKPKEIGKKYSDKLPKEYSTNNIAELVALGNAIYYAIRMNNGSATIYLDSNYALNSITKWSIGWMKNGWTKSDGGKIENLSIIKMLYYMSLSRNIKYVHVGGHSGNKGNDVVDKLAQSEARNKDKKGVMPLWFIGNL